MRSIVTNILLCGFEIIESDLSVFFLSGGATRPLQRNGGVEELHGDQTVGPRPKVWTRN